MYTNNQVKTMKHRKQQEEQRITYESRRLSRKYLSILRNYIRKSLRTDPSNYIGNSLVVTCLGKTCIIHEGRNTYPATTLYSGRWIGLIIDDYPYLSPVLYEEIYMEHGYRAAVIARDKGVKAFLYGNDLLPVSVQKVYGPKKYPLAVIDSSDHKVIGVVRWDPRNRIYRNIYDLGLFLRALG